MAKFFNYKDIDFKINSEVFYSPQVSIGASASVEPVVLSDGSLLNYAPAGGVVGNISCDIYLTSQIPSFLNVTGVDESAVNVEFAGSLITGAYCKSLSFSVEPFQPILMSVEFDWYGDFALENFIEQSNANRLSKAVPNYIAHAHKSYLDTESIFSDSESDSVGDIVSFSYSSSCDRPSFYNVGDVFPFRVAKLNKRCEINLSSNNLGKLVSINGKSVSTNIYLKDFYGNLLNNFAVSGVLTNQSYNISDGQYLLSDAIIEQTITEQKVSV